MHVERHNTIFFVVLELAKKSYFFHHKVGSINSETRVDGIFSKISFHHVDSERENTGDNYVKREIFFSTTYLTF